MKRSIKYAIYLILTVLLFLVPSVVKGEYNIMLFDQVMIFTIIVLGLNFITGLTGQTNLGVAGVFAVGAYTSALLNTRFGMSPWLTLLASLGTGLLVGAILGYPSLRIKGKYLALTTIGFGEIVRLMLNNMTTVTGGPQGVAAIQPYDFFGIRIKTEREFYYLLLVFSILAVVIASRIINSKWGRAFKAIRDNEQAVESCGISLAEVKVKAFITSTAFASVAGAFYAHLIGYINPSNFTIDLSVKFLMMLILGGIGTVPGCIIGSMFITLLPEYLRFLQDYYWLIFSVIVFIFILKWPSGIVSIFQKRTRKSVSDLKLDKSASQK